MELAHLRVFETLADELHFARAADRLGLTQPAVSRQIAALEASLGGKLFDRAKRSQVTLTATGALFLPEARAILRQAERGEALARRAARGEVGRLEIGYVASAAWGGVAAALVRRFLTRAPKVEVHLQELETPRQIEELAAGRLDLGIFRTRPAYPTELKVQPLLQDTLQIALPDSDPRAAQPVLHAADLADARFILPHFGEEAGFLARIQALGQAGGFPPEIQPPVRDFLTVLTSVSAGLGVGLVPESAGALHLQGVVLRRVADVALNSGLVLGARRADSSPLVRRFLQMAQERPKSGHG
ncbi:LysR family transcriptional regulator [Acidocella sp.]|uniref:LysR family transcriptional regulator n=1 Tax=Acidocella sp. TaxID=50710 RepID=UPI0026157104|nr:LysR family transcriptional regulator [Acidocella sp.]